MGIQTPAALAALKTRLSKAFQAAMTASPVHSARLGLYTTIDSDTEFNTYDWLAAMPGMREWIGPRIVEGFKERTFTIYNKHYERTLEVNRDKLEDSPMSAVADAGLRMELFLEAARKLDDDLLFNAAVAAPAAGQVGGLLAGGASTVCYDGQFFFDTDHPTDLDATGTQSNLEAAAFALTGPNFATARARMMAYKGENGRPLGIMPNLLVVPPALENTAHGIVTAIYGSSGASNVQVGQAKVEVVPELAALSDTTWYLFDTLSPGPKPFILQNRSPLKMVFRGSETDGPVFERNALQWGIDRRVGAGYGIWQKAFKGVG